MFKSIVVALVTALRFFRTTKVVDEKEINITQTNVVNENDQDE